MESVIIDYYNHQSKIIYSINSKTYKYSYYNRFYFFMMIFKKIHAKWRNNLLILILIDTIFQVTNGKLELYTRENGVFNEDFIMWMK